MAKKNPWKPSQMSIMAILRRIIAAWEKLNPWAVLKVVGGRIANEILMFFRSAKKTAQDVSLNDPIDTDKDGNTLTLLDTIATDDHILEDIDLRMKVRQLYDAVKTRLSPREREIVLLRYGLTGQRPLVQREVAKRLKISRSYVSRLEKKALQKLRKAFDE